MKITRKLFLIISLLCILSETFTQVKPKTEWWLEEPYRIVQTNLREIDARDFDIDVYIKSLTELLGYEESMTTNATPMVEISRQISRDGSFEWYGLMNHTGQLGNGFFAPIPIYNIKIDFKSESPVKSVKSLQSGEKLYFKAEGKNVKVTVPELKEFDIILVEY